VGRVPLVAAAVCPHPPLLVPGLAAGAAGDLAALRGAAESAVRDVLRAGADRLVVVGSGAETFTAGELEFGSLAPYGMPDAHLSRRLPLSLSVGAWLLDRIDAASPTSTEMSSLAVCDDMSAAACAAIGAAFSGHRREPAAAGESGGGERVAFLVMGDGSACRGPRAPGYDDPRAQAYDEGVAAALATADAEALLALDEKLSAELLVAGRAAWQVLAGAALAGGRAWRGRLHHAEAPFGVAYFVATWQALAGPSSGREPA
jgi:hypothetical protein